MPDATPVYAKNEERFDRNTQIWLNCKFSRASMAEIGKHFNLSGERVRDLAIKRDRQIWSLLSRIGRCPFDELSETSKKIISTLYGIEISNRLDDRHHHMTLHDPDKIKTLVVPSAGKRMSTVRHQGGWYGTSEPVSFEQLEGMHDAA